MKKKILISILIILILLLVSVVSLYNIFSNNVKKESENTELNKDMYIINNINNNVIKYDSLELSDIVFKNEDGKTKISLKAKNSSSNTYSNDKIVVELYNNKNVLIGYMVLNVEKDIEPYGEVTLSQEVEPQIEGAYSIKIVDFKEEELTSETDNKPSEVDGEINTEPKYESDEENLKNNGKK